MGSLAFKAVQKTGVEKLKTEAKNFWALEAKDIDGKLRKMQEFQHNKCVLVVNVACK